MVTPNSRQALPSEQVGTCNVTKNSVDVYDSITVFDWEAGGGIGTTPGPEVRLTSVDVDVCQSPTSATTISESTDMQGTCNTSV